MESRGRVVGKRRGTNLVNGKVSVGYELSFFTVGVAECRAYTKGLGSCDEWGGGINCYYWNGWFVRCG